MDAAIVTLKKAEADVVKVDTVRKLAYEERGSFEREIQDLQMKLGEVMRLKILAPVDGTITSIASLLEGHTVEKGEVICEVTRDPAQPSAPSDNSNSPTETPSPAIATTPSPITTAPVSEPGLNSAIQSLSSFGPASDLAKRLRDLRRKLVEIASDTESNNAELSRIDVEIRSLREKQSQIQEDDVELRKQLELMVDAIESKRRSMERTIEFQNEIRKMWAQNWPRPSTNSR